MHCTLCTAAQDGQDQDHFNLPFPGYMRMKCTLVHQFHRYTLLILAQHFVTIDGLVNKAQQLSDANMKVIHCLCNVMPEEAEASAPSDKDMIDKLVEAMPGGVEYMKVVIRGMVSLVYRMGGQSLNFVDPISQQVSL